MSSEQTPAQGGTMPNSEQSYTVTHDMLPLHCPTKEMSLWNSHPRVYLPIEEENGKINCPYCGTQFILQN